MLSIFVECHRGCGSQGGCYHSERELASTSVTGVSSSCFHSSDSTDVAAVINELQVPSEYVRNLRSEPVTVFNKFAYWKQLQTGKYIIMAFKFRLGDST